MVEKQHRLLPAITGLFVATLLISNTIDTKIIHGLGMDLSAGTLLFPLAYVVGDLMTEVYGYAVARRTIWIGFAALLLMSFSYEVTRQLPAAEFWQNQAVFDSVFSLVPRIVAASIVAYLCGEFVNSVIVAKMKVAQKGKRMGLRFVASTVGAQAIDTIVFGLIAYFGTMSLTDLAYVIFSGWAFKVSWEIVALPLTVRAVAWVKKIEKEDVYDTKTNLNPFKIFG